MLLENEDLEHMAIDWLCASGRPGTVPPDPGKDTRIRLRIALCEGEPEDSSAPGSTGAAHRSALEETQDSAAVPGHRIP